MAMCFSTIFMVRQPKCTRLAAMNAGIPLLGIGVRAPQAKQEENVFALAVATAEKLGCPGVVSRGDVVANCDYVGAGYGIPTPGCLEAISLFAECEGILLDPVYSAKAAAGLTGRLRPLPCLSSPDCWSPRGWPRCCTRQGWHWPGLPACQAGGVWRHRSNPQVHTTDLDMRDWDRLN